MTCWAICKTPKTAFTHFNISQIQSGWVFGVFAVLFSVALIWATSRPWLMDSRDGWSSKMLTNPLKKTKNTALIEDLRPVWHTKLAKLPSIGALSFPLQSRLLSAILSKCPCWDPWTYFDGIVPLHIEIDWRLACEDCISNKLLSSNKRRVTMVTYNLS